MATACTFHRFEEPLAYEWGRCSSPRPGKPAWKFEFVTQDGPTEAGYTTPAYRLHAVAFAPKRPPQSIADVWAAHPELEGLYEALRAEVPGLAVQRI